MTYFLWLLKRCDKCDYDEYDSAVVVAESEAQARQMHPSGLTVSWESSDYGGWVAPEFVIVTRLGFADDPTPRVVCASFNAG